MANRLDTFKTLANTYRQELNSLDAKIAATNDEINTLRVQLRAAELRLDGEKADRVTQVEQLRGIVTVIRGMEDREREKRQVLENQTVTSTRAIEDEEYGF
jgi:chromosome segregation ATPase